MDHQQRTQQMDCTQKRQHTTANRANKKASCDPSQSYGSNLVTTSNAVSPKYQEGKRLLGTGPSNKHIDHPATITQVSNMRAIKAEFHKEVGRKKTSGVNTQTQDAQQEQDKIPSWRYAKQNVPQYCSAHRQPQNERLQCSPCAW